MEEKKSLAVGFVGVRIFGPGKSVQSGSAGKFRMC
jgi:hypothetical protein